MRTQALGAGLLAPSPSSLAPFALHRPASVAEAVEVLSAHPSATIAAGCTDLVAQFREGHAPETVVSVRRLPELRTISYEDGVLRLGATLTHHQASTSPVVREAVPGLASAWAQIATVRIRGSATLGGNLLARRHRYELSLMLGALDAGLEFAGGETRPVGWIWESATGNHGLLTAAAVDTSDLVWFGYERSMRPLTTVALALRRGTDGVVLKAIVGSEYHEPVELTALAPTLESLADPAIIAETATALAAGLPDSVGDVAGSADYRRHVVGVLTRRLLVGRPTDLEGAA